MTLLSLFAGALRRPFALIVVALACVLATAGAAFARDVPPLRARVEDTIALLPADVRARLEQKLAAHEQATGQQFAVLIIDTLGGDPLEDFSIRVVESWKLGKRKKDDGLLLLVVRDDRKMRIEAGYGLEGEITDAFSSRVIRDVMTPAFRRGDFAGGIERAVDTLIQKATGGAVNLPAAQPVAGRRKPRVPVGLVLVGMFFVLPLLLPLLFGGRRRRGYGSKSDLLLGGLAGVLGGMSSGHRGGGWGGGGGGGGGFGGFSGGGGGFGGGGASGSW